MPALRERCLGFPGHAEMGSASVEVWSRVFVDTPRRASVRSQPDGQYSAQDVGAGASLEGVVSFGGVAAAPCLAVVGADHAEGAHVEVLQEG